jgi:hypothetical protein
MCTSSCRRQTRSRPRTSSMRHTHTHKPGRRTARQRHNRHNQAHIPPCTSTRCSAPAGSVRSPHRTLRGTCSCRLRGPTQSLARVAGSRACRDTQSCTTLRRIDSRRREARHRSPPDIRTDTSTHCTRRCRHTHRNRPDNAGCRSRCRRSSCCWRGFGRRNPTDTRSRTSLGPMRSAGPAKRCLRAVSGTRNCMWLGCTSSPDAVRGHHSRTDIRTGMNQRCTPRCRRSHRSRANTRRHIQTDWCCRTDRRAVSSCSRRNPIHTSGNCRSRTGPVASLGRRCTGSRRCWRCT